jgi:type I restriction enzyme S subunit
VKGSLTSREPWSLPRDWNWERIDDVAPVNPKRALNGTSDEVFVPFVPMAAVAEESGKIDVSERRTAVAVRKGYTRFQPSDVLFAKITPCMENGKLAVVPEFDAPFGAGSTEFHILYPQGVDPKYLFYWLSQRQFRREAEFNMTGTAGQKRVPTDFLRNAPIPVPEMETQRQIVARIDELFFDLDNGEEELRRARAELETYRKSLLKAAAIGELTADWRAAHPPKETGADLLKRILADRRARWEVEPKNRGKRYKEPERPDLTLTERLPDEWCWGSLSQLADLGTGSTPSRAEPDYWNGGIPWLKSSCVNEPVVRIADEFVTEAAVRAHRLKFFQPGTLLMALYGEGKTRGKTTVLGIRATINQALGAIAVVGMESLFVKAILDSGYQKNRLISSGGVQPNFNMAKLGNLPIPIPPLSEQREVLDRLSAALASGGELIEAAIEAAGDSAALRQSILAAAFRGELVQ